MNKVLYFTDPHFRLLPPVNRKEKKKDFIKKIFFKLEKILNIADEKDVNSIICGGDFFDNASSSHTLISKVLNIIRNNDKPFYIVPGNHDIFNGNINTLYRTALNILVESDDLKLLDELEYDNVYFKGRSFTYKEFDFSIKNKKEHNVLIPHAMITESKAPFEYYLPEKIDTDADLVLCSHYHKPFDIKENGTRFVNPGSLIRLSSIEMNYKRNPQILIIKFGKQITVKKIDFEEFGKGEEIFDKSLDDKYESNFDSFMEQINNFKQNEGINMETVMKKVSDDLDVEKEVVEEARRRLS